MTDKLFYLAAPYSHPSPTIVAMRMDTVSQWAGMLMEKGLVIYSPLDMGHSIVQKYPLPSNWEYWQKTLRVMLSRVDVIIVLKIDGWRESAGVTAEIEYARSHNMPIIYIEPTSCIEQTLAMFDQESVS